MSATLPEELLAKRDWLKNDVIPIYECLKELREVSL